MPRWQPVYADFFHPPLTEDVEELLARFQQADSVRYVVFSALWRELRLSDVFIGISSVSEMKRFCRVVLATAVKYFMPPYSYQIRVGGLYLMFAFYHTQLSTPPVHIRLALRDWTHVRSFLKDSVDSGHHDVLYIYHKLVSTKAIHYTAMPHFLTFQKQRKPKKEALCAEFVDRTTAVHDLLPAELLEELGHIQNQYEQLKEATVEVHSKVAMTHRDFTGRLKDCMSEFISWQQKSFPQSNKNKNRREEEEEDDEEEEEEEEEQEFSSRRARLLSSIKQKSYSNFQEASRSRRHRQAETVDLLVSDAEQVQEAATVLKRRPPSLRARTCKNLGMLQDGSKLQPWMLNPPKQQEKEPERRTNQAAPCKP